MFLLDYHQDLGKDLVLLPDEVYDEVVEYFEKIKIEPYRYSQALSNLHNMDLSSYRKAYVFNAEYRIILRIINNTIQVVEIIAVDEREDMKAYEKAFLRIQNT